MDFKTYEVKLAEIERDMKVKIHYEIDGVEDSYVLSGSIDEI